MTHNIIGDRNRTSVYDPDLADKMNKKVAEELRQEELARRLEEARRKRKPAAAPMAQEPQTEPPAPAIVQPAGGLEIIKGDYLQAIQAAIPKTIQTAAEIQKARIRDNSLRKLGFGTANVPIYGVELGKPFLLFFGREAFLRLYVPRIETVYKLMIRNHIYILPEEDKAWALNEGLRSGALKRFDLEELIEVNDNAEYGHFIIDTQMPARLNGAKRELAELIYGQGDDYFATMEMLTKNNIKQTKVYLLTPNYVVSIAGQNLIGRASWLSCFDSGSDFVADGRSIYYNGHINGVRRK